MLALSADLAAPDRFAPTRLGYDATPAIAEARIRAMLAEEAVVWLSTVRRDGLPNLVPTWFWWDGTALIVACPHTLPGSALGAMGARDRARGWRAICQTTPGRAVCADSAAEAPAIGTRVPSRVEPGGGEAPNAPGERV